MQVKVSENQKRLYNKWLYHSRTMRDKPFKPRKQFDDISTLNIVSLQRLERMFARNPQIDEDEYFKAPFILYQEEDHFSLDFFAKMKCIGVFKTYKKKMMELPPDSDYQVQQITDSLKFIAKFCFMNKIRLDEYIHHQTGVCYSWARHIKERKISPYILMEFTEIYSIIENMPEDERNLLLGEVGSRFLVYRNRYLQSDKVKYLVQKGIERIKEGINK